MGAIDARLQYSRGGRQVARGVPRLALERENSERDASPDHGEGHQVAPREGARSRRVSHKRANRRLLRVHGDDHDGLEGDDEADGVPAVPARKRHREELGDDPAKRGTIQQNRPHDPPDADLGAPAEQERSDDTPQQVHDGRDKDDEGRQDDIIEGTYGEVGLTRGRHRDRGRRLGGGTGTSESIIQRQRGHC